MIIRNILFAFLVIIFSLVCFASRNISGSDVSLHSSGKIKDPIEILYGSWKVMNYEWAGFPSGEEENPQRHIGKTILFFGHDRGELLIRLAVIVCKTPEYSFHYEKDAADYLLDGYRAKPKEIGIKTTDLNVVDIDCAGENNLPGYGPKASVFIINKNTIIYSTDGPFYRLKKIN